MDRYQASVINRLTDRGPTWGLVALLILHRPKLTAGVLGSVGATAIAKVVGLF